MIDFGANLKYAINMKPTSYPCKMKCVDRGLNADLTNGKIYTILDYDTDQYEIEQNDKGDRSWYNVERFTLVENLTTDEKIALAESYVGKKVIYKNETIRITDWQLVKKGENSSFIVNENADKNGFCIAVRAGGRIFPVEDVTLASEIITNVELSSSYTAKVYADKVVVGCQTISKEKVEQIWNAMNQ